ncbi:MAG TPA: hypothetical protein VFJ30_05350, partial [Phycisphaerae bacterium]|nr:hypothetical protein [Phycisphaerae bacterium]
VDAPEASPYPIILPDWPEFAQVENESCNALLRMLHITGLSLRNAESARLVGGLQIHDSKRLTDLIQRTRNLLENFIRPTEPTDMPDSSPQAEMSGPGAGGT